MDKRFTDIPIESDTKVMYQKVSKLGGYDVYYEIWSWDAIHGGSIIFANDDVSGISDQELENLVRNSGLIKKKSDITLIRLDSGFTFINFNFELDYNSN